MRAPRIPALLIVLAACGGPDPEPIQIRFRLSPETCEAPCGVTHREDAMVVESDAPVADELYAGPGQVLLFSDFDLPGGGLGVLEMAVPPSGRPKIRYRELDDGKVVFRGEITWQQVALLRVADTVLLNGSFAFTAEDGEGNVRVVTEGRIGEAVFGPSTPPATSTPPPSSGGSSGNGGGGTVIIDYRVHRTTHVDSGCDSDTSSSGGCDGGSSDGCDSSSSSSSGCEGDTSTDGCDSSSSSSGCEGDTAGGGCDGGGASGCDGDVAKGCSTVREPRGAARTAGGLWRLFWPIALVLAVNRRMKRRR